MPNTSQHDSAQTPRTGGTTAWHRPFLIMLPSIRKHARWAFRNLSPHDRDEAEQAVVACAAVAYARLVELGKPELGYATPLARFGVKQHRAGRIVGGHTSNCDVASVACQRRQGIQVENLYDWKLSLTEDRRVTPADVAAARIDIACWFETLSPRNRRLAIILAAGESTSAVARMFHVTSGRISQLRRQLYESWRQFMGETAAT